MFPILIFAADIVRHNGEMSDVPQQLATVEIEVFGFPIRLPQLHRYRKFYDKLRAGAWETRTFRVLGAHLDEQTNYVDIGAWIGVTPFWASHIAKSVVAVEPDPQCIEILRQLSPFYPKVTVLEGALSRDPTVLLHAVADFGSSETSALEIGNGPSVVAKGFSIEKIMRRAGAGPVFVKIDIEGYEYEIVGEIAKLRSFDLRGLQCAVHPQLFEKSLKGPLPVRRLKTLLKSRQFRKLLPGYRAVPGRRYSNFLSFLMFGILLRREPRGTDLVYYKQT
jgi:FkbM family methyltransferase